MIASVALTECLSIRGNANDTISSVVEMVMNSEDSRTSLRKSATRLLESPRADPMGVFLPDEDGNYFEGAEIQAGHAGSRHHFEEVIDQRGAAL